MIFNEVKNLNTQKNSKKLFFKKIRLTEISNFLSFENMKE